MNRGKAGVRSILFVHEVNYKTKPVFEMHEFPEILASKGFHVSFLHFEEGAKFWKGWNRKSTEEITGRALVESRIRLLTPFQFGIPGLDRLIAIFLLPISLMQEIKMNRPSAVVSYVFPTGGFFIMLACRIMGIAHIQRVIDYTPGLRSFPISIYLFFVEKLLFKFGTNFSTHNFFLRERILRNGNRSTKVFLNPPPISSPAKLENTQPFFLQGLKENLEKSKLNLVFLGTLYKFANVVKISESLINSQRFKDGDLHFHIFGAGPEQGSLENLLRSNPSQNRVTYYGFLEFSRIYEVLGKCDVGLVPFDTVRVGQFSLPNKALQYLAAGLTVVSTPLEGLRQTVSSECLTTYRSIDDLLNVLLDLLTDQKKLERLKSLSAKEAEKFSYENASKAFLQTLEEVVSNA